MIKRCIICGNEFDALGSDRTCSPECSHGNRVARHRRYNERRYVERAAYGKRYREANREKMIEGRRIYINANREKVSAQWARRKARKLHATPDLTNAELGAIEGLYKKARHLGKLHGEAYHVDHKVPLNRGGGHHPDNLQVIPGWMNCAKQDKLPSEFIKQCPEYRAYYEERES